MFANKDIPPAALALLRDKTEDKEAPLLFAVVGDMSLNAKYTETVFAVSAKEVTLIDEAFEGGMLRIPLDDIDTVEVKRMYGNAVATAVKKDGSQTRLMRFSYSVSGLVEAGVRFIRHVGHGGDLAEELEIVKETFDKNMSVCPKCGRTLMSPGAACLKCENKGQLFGKLAKYVVPHAKPLIFCLFLSLITTCVTLIPPYMTQKLVDDVIPNANRHYLLMIVFLLLGAYVIQFAVGGLKNVYMRRIGDKIIKELRDDVFAKAQRLPMKFYDKTSTGSVINRISGDTSTIQSFLLRCTQEVIVQLFMLLGIIVIMLIMNWKLALLALIPVPAVVVISRRFGKMIQPFYRRIWRKWTAVSSILTDSIPCIKIVKSFAGEDRATKKFDNQNEEWYKTTSAAAPAINLFPALISFTVTCGSLLIWGIGGNWVIRSGGALTLGLLVSFISYTSLFYGPVSFFAGFNDTYQNALASAERIFDILDAEPEPDFYKGSHPAEMKGTIEFKNVNFAFDKTKKALTNINLKIEAGEIVGIVGTTGSGKSTLINLLMRFYDKYDGTISIDGTDIRKIDMAFYRNKIGYVQQEPMMFSDTIYSNIAYGLPGAPIEAVIHAADIANAHAFILNQPDAYDTILGERGVGLSGGEKQRISIARAVLKNPSVLIFDEATAAVDSETEKLIQEAIERLIRGRTTIMIAHRLSTLRRANKIVVVDNGTIAECGTPEELLARKGKYYNLVKIQSMGSAELAAGLHAKTTEGGSDTWNASTSTPTK